MGISLPVPGAPKSSPGDRPIFKGLTADPYLRSFLRGLRGSENFFNSFLTPTDSLAFERMSGEVSICSRGPKSSAIRLGFFGGILIRRSIVYIV